MNDIIELTVTNGQPTTTSLAIAERFGKRHDNVLRAIAALECSEGYRRLNFEATSREVAGPNGGTRLESLYCVTKDGFMFLAMGFTGKEAAAWKERFIAAFNAMDRQLLENAAAQQIPQPSAQLFLSHTADIIVAADRTFRAGVRSGRLAGLSTAQSIRRANQLAYLKTGINLLEELKATDHLAGLEARESTDTHNPDQPVWEFLNSLQAGDLGPFGKHPMLSQHLYRLYLRWCRLQSNNRPLNLPRLMYPLFKSRQVSQSKKRYVNPDGSVFGPVSFVYFKGCGRDMSQPETVWLGDCVRRAESALADLNA